jgi:HEAT repeat protein
MEILEEAVQALGMIGDPGAVEPLIRALSDPVTGESPRIAEALADIGEPAYGPILWALSSDDAVLRRRAAGVAGLLGGVRVLEPLLGLLQDEAALNRAAAARALGFVGEQRVVPALVEALKDSSGAVREAAAEALARIGAPAAAGALLEVAG